MRWTDFHSIGLVGLLTAVLPQLEILEKILGPNFYHDVFLVVIAFFLFARKFDAEIQKFRDGLQDHVSAIESRLEGMDKGLQLVASNVRDLQESLEKVEFAHGDRINKLETQMSRMQLKVSSH